MNRSMRLASLALLAALALPGASQASHSGGSGPKDDFVAGTGLVGSPSEDDASTLHVNARVEPPRLGFPPRANEPKGRFFFRQAEPDIDIAGEVTCLAVDDNRAIVGGRVDKSKGDDSVDEGSGVLFEVVDNGEPGGDDEFNPLPVPSGEPPARGLCQFLLNEGGDIFPTALRRIQSALSLSGGGEIERGNFVVHEAAESSGR